jgi:uncharacterized phage-associated protein
MHKAEEIAETIIDLSRKRNINDLTNLKLQKLLYYSQAWHLALTDNPIFIEDVEAWIHGPVVPRVFGTFKEYRWGVISREVKPINDDSIIRHIEEVIHTYGKFGATELERLTHSEEPWISARRGLAPDEPSRNVIPKEHMKNFYQGLMVNG